MTSTNGLAGNSRWRITLIIVAMLCIVLLAARGTEPAGAGPATGTVPATYSGLVLAGPGFTPAAGMRVIASINSHECGESLTQLIDDQVVYSINVVAEGPGGVSNCGAADRMMLFRIASIPMAPIAIWNAVIALHPLAPMQVSTAPVISASRNGTDAMLTWMQVISDVNGRATLIDGYNVWGGADSYFDPTEPDCDCTLLARTTDLTYLDEGAVGDLTLRFYVVQAVNPVGASANSNRVGKFEFVLVSGN